MADKQGFIERNILRFGMPVVKLAVTAGAAWGANQLIERTGGAPDMSVEEMKTLAQTTIIVLGGTWLLKPATRVKAALTAAALGATAYAAHVGGKAADDQLVPGDRGSLTQGVQRTLDGLRS